VLAHGNGLDCRLYMSGSTSRGRRPPCGAIRSAASSPAATCQTSPDGRAVSYEKTEATCLLLVRNLNTCGYIQVKKAKGRIDRARRRFVKFVKCETGSYIATKNPALNCFGRNIRSVRLAFKGLINGNRSV
jgi:hypothetical protein